VAHLHYFISATYSLIIGTSALFHKCHVQPDHWDIFIIS